MTEKCLENIEVMNKYDCIWLGCVDRYLWPCQPGYLCLYTLCSAHPPVNLMMLSRLFGGVRAIMFYCAGYI